MPGMSSQYNQAPPPPHGYGPPTQAGAYPGPQPPVAENQQFGVVPPQNNVIQGPPDQQPQGAINDAQLISFD